MPAIVPTKCCVVCNCELITYTKYKSINTEYYSNRNAKIVGCKTHMQNKICEPCMTKLKKIEGFAVQYEQLKTEFISKYFKTKSALSGSVSSTTAAEHHVCTKSMSKDSPSPSAKSSTKARKSLDLSRGGGGKY